MAHRGGDEAEGLVAASSLKQFTYAALGLGFYRVYTAYIILYLGFDRFIVLSSFVHFRVYDV